MQEDKIKEFLDYLEQLAVKYYNDPVGLTKELFNVEPTKQQTAIMNAVVKYRKVSVRSGHNIGKQNCLNSIVYTPNGHKKWGDLKEGELVFDETGTTTKILQIHPTTKSNGYKVTFDDGSSTVCNKEHLWKVKGRQERRKGKDWTVITTEEIIKRGIYRKNGVNITRQFCIPNHGAVQFKESKVVLHPYVLGVWLGDGSVNSGRYTGIDKEVDNYIRSLGYKVKDHDYKSKSIDGLYDKLKKIGVSEKRCWEKSIPDDYKYNCIENRLELLRGLLDTDGFANKYGSIVYTSTSKKLIEDIIWLTRSLGGKAYFQEAVKNPFYRNEEGEKVYCRPAYNATLTLPNNTLCFHISRKQDRLKVKQPRRLKRWIEKIEIIEEREMRCITVESPLHTYLIDDFIVTHNSALAVFLNYWFLITRYDPKIICSANTKEQLYDVLWAEMAKWKRKSNLIDTIFEWNKDKVFHKGYPETWWAVARTASEGEGIQGRHDDNQLIILDEVSGMKDKILEATEGLMSGKDVYVLLISNPTRPSGYFYDTQMNPKLAKHWHPMAFSSLDSPLLDKNWLEYMLDKYGEDSPNYMVRVLGEFPFDTEHTLIPRGWIMDSVNREIEVDNYAPRILGVDVGAGGDQSVILHRKGGVVDRIKAFNTSDTMRLVDLVAEEYKEYKADAICIDSIGVGKGAFDRLRQRRFNVYSVDVRRKSYKKGFKNLRDELWWTTREQFEAGNISIPDDQYLQLELWSVKYKPIEKDRIKVEDKAAMKSRIKYSPDRADALCLTYFINDEDFYASANEMEDEYDNMKLMDQGAETGRSKFTGY